MNTYKSNFGPFFFVKWALAMGLFFNLIGCKYCTVATERQASITATPWRLVATNDPDFLGLNKYTFAIFTFNQDFTGTIQVVQNNTRYDEPARILNYDIDSANHLIRIQYSFPGKGSSNSTDSNQDPNNTPIEYSYKLGRSLVLEGENGYFYNFVPFTGVLSPDDTCEFNSKLF